MPRKIATQDCASVQGRGGVKSSVMFSPLKTKHNVLASVGLLSKQTKKVYSPEP